MPSPETRHLREQLLPNQAEALGVFRRLIDSQRAMVSKYCDLPLEQRAEYADEFEQAFHSTAVLLEKVHVDTRLWQDEIVRSLEIMYGRGDIRRRKIPLLSQVFVSDLKRLINKR